MNSVLNILPLLLLLVYAARASGVICFFYTTNVIVAEKEQVTTFCIKLFELLCDCDQHAVCENLYSPRYPPQFWPFSSQGYSIKTCEHNISAAQIRSFCHKSYR